MVLFCRSWSGKVSIVAHSLGAIICFDIMANQPPKGAKPPADNTPPGDTMSWDKTDGKMDVDEMCGTKKMGGVDTADPSVRFSSDGFDDGGSQGVGGKGGGGLRYNQESSAFPTLSAPVENVFCLGSPIGMFLMIRGQHRGLGKAFSLPG